LATGGQAARGNKTLSYDSIGFVGVTLKTTSSAFPQRLIDEATI